MEKLHLFSYSLGCMPRGTVPLRRTSPAATVTAANGGSRRACWVLVAGPCPRKSRVRLHSPPKPRAASNGGSRSSTRFGQDNARSASRPDVVRGAVQTRLQPCLLCRSSAACCLLTVTVVWCCCARAASYPPGGVPMPARVSPLAVCDQRAPGDFGLAPYRPSSSLQTPSSGT